MLTEFGYTVIEAISAEAAVALLNKGLRPDLIVSDLMPGISGTELARSVQHCPLAKRIMIVSGYAEAKGIEPDLPRLTTSFRKADLALSLAALA